LIITQQYQFLLTLNQILLASVQKYFRWQWWK